MKILIELPTWMGDAVMASAAIENIINYYNSPEITLIGSSISIEVLKNHSCVKRSHVLTKKQKKHRIMLKLEKLFGIELSKKHYKLV